MSNFIIDKQREMLDKLDSGEGVNPGQNTDDSSAGAPPLAPQTGVPGQEPPHADVAGAATSAQPSGGAHTPPPGTAPAGALEQQIAVLTQQKQEFESLYKRQLGMVAPLQRKTNEQDATIRDLQQKLEELNLKLSSQPGSAAPPQAPAPTAPAPAEADDPKIQEFMALYGDMIPGLEAFILNRIAPKVQQGVPADLKPALEYVQQKREDEARQALLNQHLAPLYAKHPQAGAIVRSPEFNRWVEAKPSYIRDSIVQVAVHPENYPVDQVIAIFDDYAASQGAAPASAAPSPGDMAVEVRRVPTSSTPGGKPPLQPLTRERMSQLNRALTVDRALYKPEDLAAFEAELDQGEAAATSAGFGLAPRLETLTR